VGKSQRRKLVYREVVHLFGVVSRPLRAEELLDFEGDDQHVAVEGALPGVGVDEPDDPARDPRLLEQLAQRGFGDGLPKLGESDGKAPHPLARWVLALDEEYPPQIIEHESARSGQGVLIENRAARRADVAGPIPYRLHRHPTAALRAEQRVQLMGSSVACINTCEPES
jgi:hypothetical protein